MTNLTPTNTRSDQSAARYTSMPGLQAERSAISRKDVLQNAMSGGFSQDDGSLEQLFDWLEGRK
ncbi:hypothetical protein [Sulfitobacter pacificus]|uniref:hypothetical protein n=1 Tax=Sulfitobacter pacificus TaxID=1499314 RepID=UPI003109598C